jgi:8-oxo-dGTP diphosphatase
MRSLDTVPQHDQSAFGDALSELGSRPTVGIQVAVRTLDSILLQLRQNSFGAGTWCMPGGHLEFGESFEDAAARELLEETGLYASVLNTLGSINTPYESTHYVQILVQALEYVGTPTIREPDKCGDLKFFDLRELPTPLFPPTADALKILVGKEKEQNHLCMYLLNFDPKQNRNRYINYVLLETPQPSLMMTLGRRGERSARQTRRMEFKTYNDAWSSLRDEVRKRVNHGYNLYDCSGNIAIDKVASLFPVNHGIAVRSKSWQVSSPQQELPLRTIGLDLDGEA